MKGGRAFYILALLAVGVALVPAFRTTRLRLTEIRAARAVSAGDYTQAITLFSRCEGYLEGNPDRLEYVREQIRYCREQQALAAAADPATTQPVLQNGVRIPHLPPRPGEVRTLAIKQLGNFNFDESDGTLPEDVQKLDGLHLRTSGFMIPLDQADNIHRFALVPSLLDCCYGQPPQIHHTLTVEAPAGAHFQYTAEETSVQGILHVELVREGGQIVSLFRLSDAQLISTRGRDG